MGHGPERLRGMWYRPEEAVQDEVREGVRGGQGRMHIFGDPQAPIVLRTRPSEYILALFFQTAKAKNIPQPPAVRVFAFEPRRQTNSWHTARRLKVPSNVDRHHAKGQ